MTSSLIERAQSLRGNERVQVGNGDEGRVGRVEGIAAVMSRQPAKSPLP
jgi:hypothetical protein